MSSIKKNLTYSVIYQILIIIIPFITTPYISRIVGKEGIGIYSYTYSIAHYFIIFAMLGLNNYGNRVVAKCRDDKEKLSKEFSSIYVFQVIMSILMIILYLIYIFICDKKYLIFSILQVLYVVSTLFDINWLFFGLEKFKLTIIRNVIIKVVSTIFIFLFIKKSEDLIIYTFILSISSLITQLSLWAFVKKEVKFIKPKWVDVKKHIKSNIILFIPVIAVSIYKVMDKIMLGNLSNIEQVGLYESAEKIVNVPIALIAALGTVMLPRTTNLLSNNNEKKAKEYLKNTSLFIIFISLPIIFGLFSVSDKLTILYFGEEFKDASILIKILSIDIIFIGIANVIRTQYLIPKEKDKEYIISVIVGAVINFIMNCIFIPIYNAKGAVIGTLCAEIAVCIIQIILSKEKIILRKDLKKVLGFIISSIVMYLSINYIGIYIKNDIMNIGIKIFLGIIIYFGMNFKFIWNIIGRKKMNRNENIL